MAFNIDMFGPHIRAEVSFVGGKANMIEIFNPKQTRSIKIPAEWACDVSGTDQEILDGVSASLNGAKVVKV